MRIAVLDTYYPAFQRQFYDGHPELLSAGYNEQLDALFGTWFGTSDSYAHYLRELGHDAHGFIVDVEPLQRSWAREHGRRRLALPLAVQAGGVAGRRARALVLHRIAAAQIETVDAEVVFCQNLSFFSRAQLDRLRAAGRRVVGQIAAPLPPWDIVKGFDFVLTSFPHFVERLRDHGVDSAYLKLAFDERLAALVPESEPQSARAHDVVFVGGVNPAIHPAGTALLERVCATRSVAVFGYGAEALPGSSPILRNYKGEAWGLEMYRALAAAKIALNRHIDVAEGHANNMRLYEATGMGAALLTEPAPNLAELFEPDREVATYDNADHLLTQIDRLLADADRRRDIARAGHQRTLREHTWANRIAELAELLEKRL